MPASSSSFIGEASAKQAALDHAGVSSANAVWIKAQFDRDDGRYIYELEFTADGSKFEYDVDALTGATVTSKAIAKAVNSASAYVTGADVDSGATQWGG